MDADHLDIYGTYDVLKEAFAQFAMQITPCGGSLLIKQGLMLPVPAGVRTFTYGCGEGADFQATNIHLKDDFYVYDLQTPTEVICNICVGAPGLVNVENSVAAVAAVWLTGIRTFDMRRFAGVQRRFDYRVRTEKAVYIDDYAHHPEELRFTIESVRGLYPGRYITGIFQPHLYSRTRDFADEFAQSLNLLDAVILLDIYPAREEPIEGVTSAMIFDRLSMKDKCLCTKEELIDVLKTRDPDVWISMGAGNIDTMVAPIEQLIND
jgi:UDP-N-acetylmuramate--alanine ligase